MRGLRDQLHGRCDRKRYAQTTLFARVANSQTTLAWRWTIFS
jgi:hypothetical protein